MPQPYDQTFANYLAFSTGTSKHWVNIAQTQGNRFVYLGLSKRGPELEKPPKDHLKKPEESFVMYPLESA